MFFITQITYWLRFFLSCEEVDLFELPFIDYNTTSYFSLANRKHKIYGKKYRKKKKSPYINEFQMVGYTKRIFPDIPELDRLENYQLRPI